MDVKPTNVPKNENQSEGIKTSCVHYNKLHYGTCWFKGKLKCIKCDRFSHLANDCRSKIVPAENYANEVKEEGTMFYVCHLASMVKNSSVWYVDNACSNHITGHESLLIKVNRNVTAKVKMGIGDLVQAVGNETLVNDTKQGKRYIKDVMIVPGLDENLLSVDQMVEHGYFLVFRDYLVDIFDDRTFENLVARVQMTSNMCFPMTLEYGNEVARRATVEETTWNWHMRFGHLNFQSLKSLQQKEIVYGLPEIKDASKVCKGYVMGKAHKKTFDKEKAWRATVPLELIHIDVCGPMQVFTK